jgi:hypothetical protein
VFRSTWNAGSGRACSPVLLVAVIFRHSYTFETLLEALRFPPGCHAALDDKNPAFLENDDMIGQILLLFEQNEGAGPGAVLHDSVDPFSTNDEKRLDSI